MQIEYPSEKKAQAAASGSSIGVRWSIDDTRDTWMHACLYTVYVAYHACAMHYCIMINAVNVPLCVMGDRKFS